MYSIKLDNENRIEYATYKKYASDDMVSVDVLPEGDIHDYLYMDGAYVYAPLAKHAEALGDDI